MPRRFPSGVTDVRVAGESSPHGVRPGPERVEVVERHRGIAQAIDVHRKPGCDERRDRDVDLPDIDVHPPPGGVVDDLGQQGVEVELAPEPGRCCVVFRADEARVDDAAGREPGTEASPSSP
jgi:hypothetical protein